MNNLNQIFIALHQNNNSNLFNFENIINQSLDQSLDQSPDKPVSDEFFHHLRCTTGFPKWSTNSA